jgi:beta-phosphoglucomutase
MDGVLVDSYQTHLQSWRNAAQLHGLGMTDADFKRTFGRTSRDIIAALWPGKFSDPEVLKFDQEKEAAYRELIKAQFPEMDGAGELIGALHAAGFKLAIGSSGPKENVEVVRSCVPNGQLISAMVNGLEVSKGKPEPEVFLKAAEKLGVEPRWCAVIEDAVVGVDAARRAGMLSIGLLGTAARSALEVYADWVVGSLRDLNPKAIAERIEGRPIA